MIDSHVHLDSDSYEKLEDGLSGVMLRAQEAGVTRMVAPSIHLDSHRRLVELSQRFPNIYPAAGIHPHDSSSEHNQNLASKLEEALESAEIPIVGETGLEGHYDFTPMSVQLESLRAHLQVAKSHGLPIILHCRETEETLFEELRKAQLPKGGVVHCFTGNWEWAQKFLELGYHIGLTGIVTFKKSLQVQEVAQKLPLDRLLVETDGPYLAPIPYRGKTNCPEYIPHIVAKIAELRELSPDQIAKQTVENTEKLFALPRHS